jgi:hypothetical protein
MTSVAMPLPTASPAGTMAPGGFNSAPADFTPPQPAGNAIQTVGDKTFIELEGVWTDTTFEPDTMTAQEVVFLSDAYFDLLDTLPELARYFALGENVIVVVEGIAYEVVSE